MKWTDLEGFPAHVVGQRINTDPSLWPWREELVQEMRLHMWHMFETGRVDITKKPEQIRSYVYRGLKMKLSREIEKLRVRTDHEPLDDHYELGECDLSMSDVRVDAGRITENLYSDEIQVLREAFADERPRALTKDLKRIRGSYVKKERLLSIIRDQVK